MELQGRSRKVVVATGYIVVRSSLLLPGSLAEIHHREKYLWYMKLWLKLSGTCRMVFRGISTGFPLTSDDYLLIIRVILHCFSPSGPDVRSFAYALLNLESPWVASGMLLLNLSFVPRR